MLILLVVWALSAATSLAAAPASFAATAIPETPFGLGTVVGVDGVMLTWFRGSTLTGGIPTEYVVHRRSPGHDADWVVATSTTADRWSYGDESAPVDVDVTYSVTARNATGDSAESVPVSARVPTWDGPYDPDRSSLTLVWDEAAGGDDTQRDSVVADLTSTPPLSQSGQGSATTFSAGDWRRTLSLPSGVPDGTYELGDGAGRLQMQAMAGDFCTALAGGSVPTGSATVSRSAPSMHGGYASLTLDATLGCGNGHTVRAELRWHTPDATRVLSTAPLTRLTAAPGQAATTDVTVRNAGSKAVALEAAGLVDADMSTAAPLTVQGSSCEGITLDPGAECTVTVSYTAGDAGAREGNGVLTLSTEMGAWELGAVVGEQPAAYSGPQSLTASGSPGRVDLTWEAPTTLDSRMITGWRVEEVGSGQPAVLQKIINGYPRRTVLTSLPTGGHALRLVMLTSDGRETASSPVPVTLASRWLLVTTLTGVHSYDADGGSTNGGVFGTRTGPTDGIATSPTRTAVVVGNGPWDGDVQLRGPTGEVTRTLTVGSVYADRDPDVSPDGATVALLHLGNGSENSSLIIVPTAGGTPTAVPGSEGLVNPAWTPDGAALLANDGSGAGIVRINPVTGARTTLPGTAGAIAVAVSRTGRLAYVYNWSSGPAQIRVTTLTGGSFTLVGTHAGASDLSWDPTGQWLAVTGGPYGEPQTTSLFDLRTATPTLTRELPGGSSIAWLVPQSSVPMSSLTGPAWTNSTPTLTVGATDPDDAPGGLRRECRLDGGAWAACGPTWKLTGLAAGQHTAAARSTDPSGNVSVTAERTWSVDTQVPTVTLATLPSVLTSTALRLTWTTKDTGGSGVGSVDVRYRNAPINGSFGAQFYPASWQSLKGGVLTSTLAAGKEYCFSARVRDVAGNTGAWTTERCTTVTLDDRALAASGRWSRGTSSAYAFGTYSRAVASGVSLTRSSVQARRVGVVVTTCATCGAVDVYHAGVRLGRVSLYSAAPAYRQVRWLPLQSTSRTGTVVIRTTSSKPSIVDGIVAWH